MKRGGHRPHRAKAARRRRPGARPGRRDRRSGPTSSSAATAATPPSATRPASQVDDFGVPIDVLWFRIAEQPDDPRQSLGRVSYGNDPGHCIDRGDYWQCAFVIRQGRLRRRSSAGPASLPRRASCALAPFLADRVDELDDWDHVKLLTVAVNRLAQLVPPRPPLHRRRRPRHVARRRRRHQPRDPGRRRHRQPPR